MIGKLDPEENVMDESVTYPGIDGRTTRLKPLYWKN